MSLVRWNPLRDLHLAARDLDRFLDWPMPLRWEHVSTRLPAVEVSETDDEVIVKAELPGIDKRHLSLALVDGSLVISGEAKEEKEENKKDFFKREIRYGSVYRRVPLPSEVKSDKAKARLRRGVLEVKLPKTEAVKARQIKVEFEK